MRRNRRPTRVFQCRITNAINRRLETFQHIAHQVASEVQQFMVIHMDGPTNSSPGSSTPPQPMETDDKYMTPTTSTDEQIIDDEILPSPTSASAVAETVAPVDMEPLPNVVVGSESWHNGLPPTWLPYPADPYSDAYLCGMSSKRRKLIESTKPSGSNPPQILTDTLRHVIQSQSNANSITLTTEEALAANPHIQEPYGSFEQAIRNTVQDRIQCDRDYNPERFPNCAKIN
ncbi:Large proline-rich protein BAG6 [Pseudolycoriella hygida]|uniref:Large proline-rich protein BAG6 n=1 Tax=Pseudolycoriella hygida TaxID=35572 RepID=A0A9Q0N128_9DIPT|nr:Large proline-rich protein BAG6 [Pseudolycoriella hygida]